MADAQIRAVITAKDEASSVVSNFGNAIGKAVVPVGLMTGALVGFGVQAVKAFTESDAVARQLDAVLQSTAGAAGVTKDAALKLSKELEHLNGISDETALNAENVLLTFTKVSQDIFPEATQAAIDMATALNHGMVPSMEDVQTKTVLLGKALQDPDAGLGALKRVGVNVDELKKKFTEGMTVQDKQKLILQELATEFGGAGKAAGESFGGQIAKLTENFDDLMEVIGKAIVDTLKPLLDKIGPLVEAIRKWAEANPALAKTITMVAIAVAGLGAAFVALAAVGMILDAVFSPFVLIAFAVIAAIGLIAYGVNEVVKAFGGWGEVLKALQPTIQFFKDLWQTIVDLFNEYLLPVLQALWTIFVEQILPALKEFWEKNRDWIIPTLKLLAVIIGGVVLVTLASFVAGIAFVVAALYGIVKAVTWVIDMFRWFNDTTTAIARNLWNGVAGAINGFANNLYNWARDTVNGIVGFFTQLPGRISGAIGQAGNAVGKALHIPGFATGVTNFGGGLALVGEQGPEVVALPRGANVIPNDQIGSMGGGSGSTINITVQAGAFMGSQQDARQYAMVIADALKDIANSRAMTVGELLV